MLRLGGTQVLQCPWQAGGEFCSAGCKLLTIPPSTFSWAFSRAILTAPELFHKVLEDDRDPGAGSSHCRVSSKESWGPARGRPGCLLKKNKFQTQCLELWGTCDFIRKGKLAILTLWFYWKGWLHLHSWLSGVLGPLLVLCQWRFCHWRHREPSSHHLATVSVATTQKPH